MTFFDDYLSADIEQRNAFIETKLIEAIRRGGEDDLLGEIERFNLSPSEMKSMLAHTIGSLNRTEIERNRLRRGMR